jgi:hypothetical protein
LQVFSNEIDSVNRNINGFISGGHLDTGAGTYMVSDTRRRQTYAPRSGVSHAGNSAENAKEGISRRDRIVEILANKGHASIKDITDIIKDCSEKTVQRELNAMIKDSVAVREGERRWSVYSLSKES